MRDLEDILKELKSAEKEYAEKCKKYGIEEKKSKKKDENVADENTVEENSQESKEQNIQNQA